MDDPTAAPPTITTSKLELTHASDEGRVARGLHGG